MPLKPFDNTGDPFIDPNTGGGMEPGTPYGGPLGGDGGMYPDTGYKPKTTIGVGSSNTGIGSSKKKIGVGSSNTKVKTGIKVIGPNGKYPSNGLPDGINVAVDSGTGIGGDSIKVDIYTGIPKVIFDDYVDVNDYKIWEHDLKTNYGTPYVLPPTVKKENTPMDILPKLGEPLIPPTIVDTNNKYWTWNDCNKRWWTPDVIPNNQLSPSVLGGQPGGAPDSMSTGVNYIPNNMAWTSWDANRGEWIRRNIKDWCTPEDKVGIPPMDDCAKYGINCPDSIPSGKIFTKIDSSDRLPLKNQMVTYGIWSDNVGNLTTFHTCSAADVPFRKSCGGYNLISASSDLYNITVLDKACGNCGASAQFDIAYGHDGGSGSKDLGGYDWLTPTNAVYSQYRLLCYGNEKPWFTIGNKRINHFYAINIKKDRLRDGLDEGNIELNIAHLSGSLFELGGGSRNAHTGSNVKIAGNGKVLRLIDDSKLNFDKDLSDAALSSSYFEVGEDRAKLKSSGGDVYYMVSGSLEQGVYSKSNPVVYGLLFPLLGVIVIDGDMLDANAGFLSVTGSDVAGNNAMKLFTAISGAALYTDDSGDVLGFQARRQVEEWMEYMFIRVKNGDYNFTNNKTYQSGSGGDISPDLSGNPFVYITEIGFYNDQKELLAIGKLSQPILKNYVNEGLFNVRLGYK